MSDEELEPQLERATATLRNALNEACGTNIERLDTGELIRVEEVLAIANEAAKEAISVRRRLRRDRGAGRRGSSAAKHAPPGASRTVSAEGKQWTVFAVFPSTERGRAVIREGFAQGWLSFDAGDETRRLAPIPSDWETVPDEALVEWCGRAEPSKRKRRPT